MVIFVLNTRDFVLKTRNYVSKTRMFELKMMNCADTGTEDPDLVLSPTKPSFLMQKPSFVIQNSSFLMQNSSLVIQNPVGISWTFN